MRNYCCFVDEMLSVSRKGRQGKPQSNAKFKSKFFASYFANFA